jgi:hypothetical protein
MIDVVCARRKPVDEVYAQHMFKHKRPAPKNTLDEKERDSRKRRIIEKFDADE